MSPRPRFTNHATEQLEEREISREEVAAVIDAPIRVTIGATAVEGQFERGEVVSVVGPDGREIARGLANYGAQETARILRKPTAEIEAALGYIAEPELIHRDNLVVL